MCVDSLLRQSKTEWFTKFKSFIVQNQLKIVQLRYGVLKMVIWVGLDIFFAVTVPTNFMVWLEGWHFHLIRREFLTVRFVFCIIRYRAQMTFYLGRPIHHSYRNLKISLKSQRLYLHKDISGWLLWRFETLWNCVSNDSKFYCFEHDLIRDIINLKDKESKR